MKFKSIIELIQKVLIIAFCILFVQDVQAQNPKSSKWKNVGGEIILSGNHNFTESWSSHTYSRQDKNKWSWGGFWDKRKPQIPWENTVLNAIYPNKGQITVQGPGNIGLYLRANGPRIHLTNAKTKAGFPPWSNTVSISRQIWGYGPVKDYNMDGEFKGFIPSGEEVILNVTAVGDIIIS